MNCEQVRIWKEVIGMFIDTDVCLESLKTTMKDLCDVLRSGRDSNQKPIKQSSGVSLRQSSRNVQFTKLVLILNVSNSFDPDCTTTS
jgi:hypothetical protein